MAAPLPSLGKAVFAGSSAASRDRGDGAVTFGDMLQLAHSRWAKLGKDFYSKKKNIFDISKIPDIYDCVKYDVIHNSELLRMEPPNLMKIFIVSKLLADIVVPQEYGITSREKFGIGSKICSSLLRKIRGDLNNTYDESETVHRLNADYAPDAGINSATRHVRTRLYFTSESHLHSLLNVFRFGGIIDKNVPSPPASSENLIGDSRELGYLTHIVIRLYETISDEDAVADSDAADEKGYGERGVVVNTSSDEEGKHMHISEGRFRLKVTLSAGIAMENLEGNEDDSASHQTVGPAKLTSPPVTLWENLSLHGMLELIESAINASQTDPESDRIRKSPSVKHYSAVSP